MKRREFLSMALGAAVVASIVPSVVPATEPLSRAKMLEMIYTGLAEMASDYINSDEKERQIIIEELNKAIGGLRGETARQAMTEFRDGLLSYSAKTEVQNGK